MTRFDATFSDYVSPVGWRLSTALEVLDISTEPFDRDRSPDSDGYSHHRVLAINPQPKLWSVPVIAVHELAHIVLGHTFFVAQLEDLGLITTTPVPLARFELEAHTVAKAVGIGMHLTARELPGTLMSTYIETSARLAGSPLTDKDAVRLARAVLAILKAGIE